MVDLVAVVWFHGIWYGLAMFGIAHRVHTLMNKKKHQLILQNCFKTIILCNQLGRSIVMQQNFETGYLNVVFWYLGLTTCQCQLTWLSNTYLENWKSIILDIFCRVY